MIEPPHSWIYQDVDGSIRHGGPLPPAILAGSFNPLHHGHRRLAAVAERLLQLPVAFEMSMANVDKPELSEEEVHRRLRQFVALAPIYLTRAPTFAMKAALFPGSIMVVGCDTAVRIVDPRYYRDDTSRRDDALRSIRDHGCRFLVAGRTDPSGQFLHLGGIELPQPHADLFTAIPESLFREDVSSSELRLRLDTNAAVP